MASGSSSSMLDYNKEIVKINDDATFNTYKCLFDYLSKSHDKTILANTIKTMLGDALGESIISHKMRLLLKAIPDINNPAYGAFEIVYKAISTCSIIIINDFHEAGFDFNQKNPTGHKTLIDHAVTSRNEEIVEKLLQYGAIPSNETNETNEKKATTINYACGLHYSTKIISTMLERGADPNIITKGSLSPLCCAIRSKNRDIINLLIPHISFSCPKRLKGYMIEAIALDDIETVKAICDAHNLEPYNSEILLAVKFRRAKILELFLQKISNATITTSEGIQFSLNYACILGYADIVKVFLKYNVPIDVKNRSGFLPIYYAMANEHHETVELLESHNPTPKE